jgi:hypothetical protein
MIDNGLVRTASKEYTGRSSTNTYAETKVINFEDKISKHPINGIIG